MSTWHYFHELKVLHESISSPCNTNHEPKVGAISKRAFTYIHISHPMIQCQLETFFFGLKVSNGSISSPCNTCHEPRQGTAPSRPGSPSGFRCRRHGQRCPRRHGSPPEKSESIEMLIFNLNICKNGSLRNSLQESIQKKSACSNNSEYQLGFHNVSTNVCYLVLSYWTDIQTYCFLCATIFSTLQVTSCCVNKMPNIFVEFLYYYSVKL